MDDPIRRSEQLRLDASDPVRVVLAEADAPGSLHYLIEAEGFRIVGCASDEVELDRILEQDVQPDVIVLDTDISASSVLVAREKAPSSHLIVIWPDGVQLPVNAERVAPRLVYEELGPAIRHAVGERVRHPSAVEESRSPTPVEPILVDESSSGGRRTASRVSVTSVVLVAAILLTMSASFALEGWNGRNAATPSRTTGAAQSTAVDRAPTASPATVRREPDVQEPTLDPCTSAGKSDRKAPNAHAASNARDAHDRCRSSGDSAKEPAHPSANDHRTGNPNGTAHGNSGDHGPPDDHPSGPPPTPGAPRQGPKD